MWQDDILPCETENLVDSSSGSDLSDVVISSSWNSDDDGEKLSAFSSHASAVSFILLSAANYI